MRRTMVGVLVGVFGVLVCMTPVAAAATPACVGDCDGSGDVTVNKLITMVNIALGAASLSDCTAGDADGDGEIAINEIIAAVNNALGGCPTPVPTATPTLALTPTPTTAPDTVRSLLFFKESASIAANGNYPPAAPKPVCGADDRRFLVELATGNPFNYKVPRRLADIKTAPSEIMVSGTAVDASLGTGDFPFDHTFGSDFNMDVTPDPPYLPAAQGDGLEIGGLHVELSEGQLPHEQAAAGPATGQSWADMSDRARQGIYMRFVPDAGDRVLVMGHWVIDCGHTNFDTELHPITFMASGRAVGTKTVVNAFYNPVRETQLYHPDPAKALAFADPSRLTDPVAAPFPKALITDVLRLQNLGPVGYTSIDHMESWAMLEPNHTSPVDWRVCAPAGSTGGHLDIKYHWITRPGVEIQVVADDATGCAQVHTNLGTATIAPPPARVCVLPWDFLNQEAAAEAGIPGLDLQAKLEPYVAAPFKGGLVPDPILNCYDPMMVPALEDMPAGTQIDVMDGVLLPFYGTVTVERTAN